MLILPQNLNMKFIYSCCLLLLVTSVSVAEGIEFFDGSWEDALAKAKAEEKLIFVDAYAKWCGPCKKMAASTFKDESVGTFFNDNFVSMKIDMEESLGRTFGQTYAVSAYPTLFFIMPNGEVAKKAVGFKDVDKLMDLGNTVLGTADFSGKYKEKYDDGDRDFQTVLDYVMSLNKAGKPSLKIANDYLASDHGMTAEQQNKFLFESVSEADSKLFDLCIENKSSLISAFGEEAYEEKLYQAAKKTTKKAIDNEYSELIDEAVKKLKPINKSLSEKYRLESYLDYSASYKDWTGYQEYYKAYSKKYTKNNVSANMRLVELTSRHFSDKPEGQAIIIENLKTAVEAEPSEKGYLELLQTMHKFGKVSEALNLGKDAVELLKAKDITVHRLEGFINYLESSKQ